MQSPYKPKWVDFGGIIEAFDPHAFLASVSENTTTMLSTYSENKLTELATHLRGAGLRTTAMKYQLRGIQFLWEHFKRRAEMKELPPYDWLPLTASSSSNSAAWFNVVTHQVVASVGEPVTGHFSSSKSCVLSDELTARP